MQEAYPAAGFTLDKWFGLVISGVTGTEVSRAGLLRVLKAAAPGKRQWWRGCWGRDLLAGSVAPGMRSTGMHADNSVTAMSNSLEIVVVGHMGISMPAEGMLMQTSSLCCSTLHNSSQ